MSMIMKGRQSRAARFLAVLVVIPLLATLSTSCTKDRNKYDDEQFYKDVAWGLMTGLADIYNQCD